MKKPIDLYIPNFTKISLPSYYDEKKGEYPLSELQTRRWCVRNIAKNWNILDVGAHIGTYTVLFGLLSSEGQVLAFEPTSSSQMLRENIEANHLTNVTIINKAIADKPGNRNDAIYKLWPNEVDRNEFDFSTVDIEVKKIGWDRVDLIKIDVDSFDFEVLKGAFETIKKFNPYVIVELNHALDKRGYHLSEVLDWLASIGYSSAKVLDKENFLLKRCDPQKMESFKSISIEYDHEIISASVCPLGSEEICGAAQYNPKLHNPLERKSNLIRFNKDAWAYLVEWNASSDKTGMAIVEIEIESKGGDVGVICTDEADKKILGKEFFIFPGGKIKARIFIENIEELGRIIIRKGPKISGETTITFSHPKICFANNLFEDIPAAFNENINSISYEELAKGLTLSHSLSSSGELKIIDIKNLPTSLGNSNFYMRPPNSVLKNSLNELPMETYDSKILSQIYRILNPSKHLEFGTLEGFGTLLCLQNSNANVWTINLPDGERDNLGKIIYRNERGSLDEGDSIGRLYREAGHADRVTQILIDSREFDHMKFDKGFFDTVLIDGGHAPDVVKSDTEKAIYLTRSGGCIIWHDFCPFEDVYKYSSASLGVVEAIALYMSEWKDKFSDIFWVRPSWILIALRN